MRLKKSLHGNHSKFNETLKKLYDENFIERIIKKDHTLWSNSPEEIVNRLDWLFSPEEYLTHLNELNDFAEEIKNAGFKKAVLLGMGGSSLAPEVFMQIFGNFSDYPELLVVDSTHPAQILAVENKLDFANTLFIVSTKSGGTVETLSLMKYFFNKIKSVKGEKTGEHFVAVTDPGSKLQTLAEELHFRKIFLNNPNIGGRFSALSYFGLVPASVIGSDLKKLLNMAKRFSEETINSESSEENYSMLLGTFLGLLAEEGKDKLTLVFSEKLKPAGAWIEQLIAESTGKKGKGILPVLTDSVSIPAKYSRDRIFVYTHTDSDDKKRLAVENLKRNGFPVIEIILDDIYELGAYFYLWEFATAVAGHIMNINPFDQPDVEAAKIAAKEFVNRYIETGETGDAGEGVYFKNAIYFPNGKVKPLSKMFSELFCKVSDCLDDYYGRPYVAIQAFLENNSTNRKIFERLENYIFSKFNVAVTIGFGPRFLHSTGQLHKGDSGNGIFIQFAERTNYDLKIPDEPGSEEALLTFDALIFAQSLGDRKALLEKGRNVLRIEINENLNEVINQIIEILERENN